MGIELPDIPGNTLLKDRKEPALPAPEVKPMELRGSVEVKKKGLGRRLGEALLPSDMEATKANIWSKIIIPTIKNLIFDAFEEFLFNGSKSGRSKGGYVSPLDKPSYVNYVDYSNGRSSSRQEATRGANERDFDYRHIYFAVAEDATECLHNLIEILDHYPSATIGNLYDILRKPTTPSLFDFGWRSLKDAQIVQERGGGATLYLPRAIPLD